MSASGLFIAIEGIDGSGKSGLLVHLTALLTVDGYTVLATAEPGGTPGGAALRHLLLSRNGPAWTPMAELLLMMAARAEHIDRVIRPALAAGKIVLCDRFLGSSLAYQGGGRGLDEATIRHLHDVAFGGLRPDFTLCLDLDITVALARSHRRLDVERLDEGRFEALDSGFHERVRRAFLAQATRDPDRVAVIPADRPQAEVYAQAAHRLRQFLAEPGTW